MRASTAPITHARWLISGSYPSTTRSSEPTRKTRAEHATRTAEPSPSAHHRPPARTAGDASHRIAGAHDKTTLRGRSAHRGCRPANLPPRPRPLFPIRQLYRSFNGGERTRTRTSTSADRPRRRGPRGNCMPRKGSWRGRLRERRELHDGAETTSPARPPHAATPLAAAFSLPPWLAVSPSSSGP